MFGNAGRIRLEDTVQNSFTTYIIFHIMIISTMVVSGYYLWLQVWRSSFIKKIAIIGFVLVSCLFIPYVTPIRSSHFYLISYVPAGEYLRDHIGLNWFYMDWSGWSITIMLYLGVINAAFILFFVKNLPVYYRKFVQGK